MSSWWGSDPFADLVGKATSELLPAGQEDIALNLEVCDQVRSKQVQPKQAIQVIKKRISDANPNVVLLALGLTDICIKNGGDHFLAEVASREFMDNLTSVINRPSGVNHDVKAKALRLIQEWAMISEAKLEMRYITEVYRQLKSEGAVFPAIDPAAVASAAFVETLTAPVWIDGDVCMRCRTSFTTFNRKHHCRNCGNVFCQQCSAHTMALPWYGIGQEVRVCDGCFNKKAAPKHLPKLQRSTTSITPPIAPSGRGGAASHHRSATTGSKPKKTKREEDDLALAIKLSLQDSRGASSSQSLSAPSEPTQRATRQANGRMLEGTDADDDPDLAAAIAASLREYAPPQPSAPADFGGSEIADASRLRQQPSQSEVKQRSDLSLPPSLELPPQEVDSLLTFAQALRVHEQQAWQSGVESLPSHQVQTLYDKATAARPKMARSLDEAGRRHGVLMSMHDKLTEAVRLYDRLLDAQMSRPIGAYVQQPSDPQYRYEHPSQHPAGYDHPQHNQANAYNVHASHPEWHPHHQQQTYTHPQQPLTGESYAGYGPPPQTAPAASGSMYPDLPSAPLTEPQQIATSSHYAATPASPYAAHQQQGNLHQEHYGPPHSSFSQDIASPSQQQHNYEHSHQPQQPTTSWQQPTRPLYEFDDQAQGAQYRQSEQAGQYAPHPPSEADSLQASAPGMQRAMSDTSLDNFQKIMSPSVPQDELRQPSEGTLHHASYAQANGHAVRSAGEAPRDLYTWDAPSVPTSEPGMAQSNAEAVESSQSQWRKADVPALIEL